MKYLKVLFHDIGRLLYHILRGAAGILAITMIVTAVISMDPHQDIDINVYFVLASRAFTSLVVLGIVFLLCTKYIDDLIERAQQ